MTDPNLPPDPTSLAAGIVARNAVTATPAATFPGQSLSPPSSDFLKNWTADIQTRYGLTPYVPNLTDQYTSRLRQPLAPTEQRLLESGPTGQGGQLDYGLLDLIERPELAVRAAQIGLRDTPIAVAMRAARSGLTNLMELDKASSLADPDYDPWTDPQIRRAGLDQRMELFYGSTSRRTTEQLISRIRDNQKDDEWLSRAGLPANAIAFGAGLLGDPLNYLPGMAGVKGLQLLNRLRAGTITGNEMRLLAQRPAVWGGIADGLRAASVQMSFAIAENALVHQMDPTVPGDISADIAVLGAISGSIGLLTGLSTRWVGRGLAQEVRQAGYMAPPGARPSGAGQRAGGIADGVPGAAGGPVVRLSDEISPDFHGAAEATFGGVSRSAAEMAPGHRMITPNGEVWTVQVDQTGRPRFWREPKPSDAKVPDANNGAFAPGALATEYGPLRKAEHQADPATQGFGQPPVTGARGTGTAADPILTGQPAGLHLDWRGVFFAETHQGIRNAADYPPGTHFKTTDGVVFKVETPRQGETPYFVKVSEPDLPRGLRDVDREFKPGELEEVTSEGAHQPGSVGAQLNPESLAYQQSVLRSQGRLAATGLGLENLPINPVVRAFQGASVAMMRLVADLVSTGGLQTVGNKQGIANMMPVEALIAVNWNRPTVQALRDIQDQWSAYRHKLANGSAMPKDAVDWQGRSDMARFSEQVGTALKDRFSPGEKPLSYSQFRARVGEALRNGDSDLLQDAASPYVEAAAGHARQLLEHTKARAVEVDLFAEQYQKAVYQAQSELRAIKKEGDQVKKTAQKEKWSATKLREAEEALLVRYDDAQFKMKQTQELLDKLKANGPFLDGTAPSYAPRLWRADKLIANEEAFVSKVTGWLQSRAAAGGRIADTQEAVRVAKQIFDTLSKQNPIYERGDAEALFKSVAGPSSAQARSFRIPDALVREYLEDDVETMLRFHTKQMGTAIEMKQRFGSTDLADEIAEVQMEYRAEIQKAKDAGKHEQAALLDKQMKTAIADAQALRDKLYGTYGASEDPHRWQSRTIRMAKQFSNLTLLGMSGITALGDLARPLMTEGLEAVYGYGFKSLVSESRSTILRMNRRELELEGNGMELLNNVRALQAADTGDFFGGRGKVEHTVNMANQWFFVANGLNAVNQLDKEWARLSIGGRVNKILLDTLVDVPFSAIDRGRFAAVGIDMAGARRIGLQLQIHGIEFGQGANPLIMANTEKWTDTYARDLYRTAMHQMVNRTVPTPGVGDRPNWMSTEIGGLVSQYKSFGVASLVRGAYSGLQEGGNAFWYGAAASVGFAILLNEVRSRLFYDKSTFDKPLPAILADGVDRASVLGVLGDANRAIETLTGNRVGIRPMMGASKPVDPSFVNVAGLAGPAAGQAARIVKVADDHLSGHTTAQTWRNWRTLTPGNTLPYADPLMDAIFPTNYQRASRPKN